MRSSRNCSAAVRPGAVEALSRRLAWRMATGDLPAISAARARASVRGSSETRVHRPMAAASVAGEHAAGVGELAGDVVADQAGQQPRAGHVGDEAPAHLEHRELGVGGDEADVGAERDLQSTAEARSGDGGDDRDLEPAPHPAGLLAEVGLAVAGGHDPRGHVGIAARRAGVVRGRPAICWKAARSSPAQNARPSPDSTTARTERSSASDWPAATTAAMRCWSRAFSLSGRLRRTSATPPSIEIVTRSVGGHVH